MKVNITHKALTSLNRDDLEILFVEIQNFLKTDSLSSDTKLHELAVSMNQETIHDNCQIELEKIIMYVGIELSTLLLAEK